MASRVERYLAWRSQFGAMLTNLEEANSAIMGVNAYLILDHDRLDALLDLAGKGIETLRSELRSLKGIPFDGTKRS
jgi:hypothetical protein